MIYSKEKILELFNLEVGKKYKLADGIFTLNKNKRNEYVFENENDEIYFNDLSIDELNTIENVFEDGDFKLLGNCTCKEIGYCFDCPLNNINLECPRNGITLNQWLNDNKEELKYLYESLLKIFKETKVNIKNDK